MVWLTGGLFGGPPLVFLVGLSEAGPSARARRRRAGAASVTSAALSHATRALSCARARDQGSLAGGRPLTPDTGQAEREADALRSARGQPLELPPCARCAPLSVSLFFIAARASEAAQADEEDDPVGWATSSARIDGGCVVASGEEPVLGVPSRHPSLLLSRYDVCACAVACGSCWWWCACVCGYLCVLVGRWRRAHRDKTGERAGSVGGGGSSSGPLPAAAQARHDEQRLSINHRIKCWVSIISQV
jgi:hypothetical protein